MLNRAILLLSSSLVLLAACAEKDSSKTPQLSAERLERRIIELASDEFMGRKPFTEGEKRTLDYLQKEFAAAGLEPGNGASYLQEVPMVEITTTADASMRLRTRDKSFELKGYDEYVVWSRVPTGTALENTELVFAGYGIVAPEYNWNDYEGLDVKDKVVLVMVNDPGFGSDDSTFFKGSTMTYYGRWTYKFEEAARQGAKGCLVIHEDAAASYPFGVLQNSWNTAKLYLESNQAACPVEGWISLPATRKLFESVGLNLTGELAAAKKPGYKGRPLGIRATISLPAVSQRNNSYNVIGKITGTTRPEEVIIYTAHWDHLGVGIPDASGDSIYNGALDNASGTAGILEIAEAFKMLNPKPERTVAFLAVTAEEEGLLGSAHYVRNPIFPHANTVASINIDVLSSFGRMKNIVIVGYGQSELDDYVKAICKETGRYVSPDPHPEAGFYFRSDHFNFAKAGIPALYVDPGNDHITGGIAYGEKMAADYTANRYHQPADEYDPAVWHLDGALEDLQLLFEVGRRLAFESTWPQWNEGSEFKAIREASRAKE
jgi:Zn-dependent M28 family amino/carboxypeptidase